MRGFTAPALVGTLVAVAIVAAGGVGVEVLVLAAVAAGVFADLARRAIRERFLAGGDPTDVAVAVAFLAILAAAAFERGATGERFGDAWPQLVVGALLVSAGVVLRTIAARELGANFAVRLGLREDHRLIASGPYRWVRHPNYAALLLVAVGTALAFASRLALAVTVGLWLPLVLLRIVREERMLLARFREDYRSYMRRTWRLIVGIY